MKKSLFTFCLIGLVTMIYAQKPKLFIEYNNESEGWLALNIEKTDNWEIVGTNDKSNVILRVQISQSAFKATGKLYIIDSNTGETIYNSKTRKGQSTIFNGYSPKKDLCGKLIDDLEENFDKKKINLSTYGMKNVTTNENVIVKDSDKYDKLKKLKELLDQKVITQEEFDKEKKKLLEN